MADGIILVNGPAGEVWFDSDIAFAGVPLDALNVADGASGFTRTYPDLAGRSVKIIGLTIGMAVGGATMDYSLGYPRLTVTTVTGQRRIFILVAM